ncbi:hypothetical protein LAV72_18775 [Lysinibacillus xylanilyticus]|uniref:hypothetical protein n=1 Tax=Lysinibacillus xylanilyticus TaxID=582475 RepID=UPI002B24005C|nr:hypothetical protein [Lysinibacillus xylanilyticus]MEB2301652.1 hypothetical protein [Lysinibacillus xylanilyticus]
MTPTFNSKNERPWLTENHKRRSDRSIRIGKETIDRLIKKGIPVTFANVAQCSKEVDIEGKGIHENTIRSNEELYEYYKQHSKTFKQRENSKGFKLNNLNLDNNFQILKVDRNLDNLHRKYMKLSKQELAQRLILAEQYISENENKWVTAHFESFK